MTVVYVSRISDWAIDEYERMETVLPIARVRKARRFFKEEDRQSSLLASYMMQQLIGQTIAYTREGKPYRTEGDIHFSVAHSEGVVIVAVSEALVGVDCELANLAPINEVISLFHPFEQVSIRSGRTSFSYVWTAKEAYGKLRGCGLNYDLSTMYTSRHRLYTGHIRLKPYMYHMQFDDMMIAVCSLKAKRPKICHFKRSAIYATSVRGNIN